MRAPKFSIVLAGGKGTRMRSTDRHKVCFPIDGRPAINRALDVYRQCGIRHQIVVVGAMAGQVIATVGQEHEGVIFAYQARQLGTAHATRQGALVLEALGEDSEVLIVAGDRVVEPIVLEQLFDLYYSQHCDLAFLIGPRGRRSDPGRILRYPDGTIMGNVEASDVRQRRILAWLRREALAGRAPGRDEVLAEIERDFTPSKAAVAFGDLWQVLAEEGRAPTPEEVLDSVPPERTGFTVLDQRGEPVFLTPEEVDAVQVANFSVYLVKTQALQVALSRLDRNNAQQQEYLSDIITILAQARHEGQPQFGVRGLYVSNPNYVMAFNDPAELLEIEEYMQSKKQAVMASKLSPSPAFRPIAGWQSLFDDVASGGVDRQEPLWQELVALYGDGPAMIQERAKAYRHVLHRAGQILGTEEPALLVRSPGRVNLMGRHVDHQGGHCNLMTIGYETLMVVHPRNDDRIVIHNVDETRFPERQFSIGELIVDLPWDDWLSLINSEKVSRMALSADGDWSQYVKAAVLRLQKKFSSVRLRGVDLVVHGNIPIAAGLSSSSALIVATAEAMVRVNQLDTFPSQFIDLCGEGEWFVGTRGGSADHAAIKLGQRGKVVKVSFFPFAVQDVVPFLDDYSLVVCDSGIEAPKTTTARDQFNQRIACYHIGLRWVKRLFPQYAPLLEHLRDINVRTLGVPLSTLYKILLRLPEQATLAQLRAGLPAEELEPFLANHRLPSDGLYPLRGTVLFGLAECERSRVFGELLQSGRVDEIGRLMQRSHDGDRVAYLGPDDRMVPFQAPISNGYLLDLIEDLESGDPARVLRAQIEFQPGSYRCSTPEIDHMVDLALGTEGVIGAQLAGAGLGGCMMVLAHKTALGELTQRLEERYYRPANKPPSMLLCEPIAGSGVLLSDRLTQLPVGERS